MKGLSGFMKQAQMMQQKMAKLKEEAAQFTAEASAGGGAVVAVVNGSQQLVRLTIKPEVAVADDVEMLQDLVTTAVNEALRKVQSDLAAKMSDITGGLSIPGLM
ncbi:MAG TPA: YbaB/EbfC family nucleoid-associated protein [Geobacterales bacterium]|nr:YbaB/EbfC family nucleoid-associated protein [Geobacterales bacterium]